MEKSNWTGQGLLFPRSIYLDIRGRTELTRTGVDVLWGPDEERRLPRVYVGQGNELKQRLNDHNTNKDFWNSCVAFISKDSNLNTAHVQYLEAKLVNLLEEASRCVLENTQHPQEPSLSDADKADAELFLMDMLLCLPIAGVNFFEKSGAQGEKHEIPTLTMSGKGIKGEGYQDGTSFVVLANSLAVKDEVDSIPLQIATLRRELKTEGILVEDGDHCRFNEDYIFNSPSAASGVLLGASSNGRDTWKDSQGRSLNQMGEEISDPD